MKVVRMGWRKLGPPLLTQTLSPAPNICNVAFAAFGVSEELHMLEFVTSRKPREGVEQKGKHQKDKNSFGSKSTSEAAFEQ